MGCVTDPITEDPQMGPHLTKRCIPNDLWGVTVISTCKVFVLIVLLTSIEKNVFVSAFCSQEMYFQVDFS